ncbi:hypothetical protein MASR1M32_29800 [Rhodobacter sp.]
MPEKVRSVDREDVIGQVWRNRPGKIKTGTPGLKMYGCAQAGQAPQGPDKDGGEGD